MSRWSEPAHLARRRLARKVGLRWLAIEVAGALLGAAYLAMGLVVLLAIAVHSLLPLLLWLPILVLFVWAWHLPRELWRDA